MTEDRERGLGQGAEIPPERRRAVGTTLLALLVVAFAFLPWGKVPVKPFGADLGFDTLPGFPTITVDGWHGFVTPHLFSVSVELPNWLVVLAAATVAVLCWLRSSGIWRAPGPLLATLVAYGAVHSFFVPLALASADGGAAALGSVLTGATWIAIGVVLARTRSGVAGTSGAPA